MKKVKKIFFLIFLLGASTSLFARNEQPSLWIGPDMGYMNGLGGGINVTVFNLIPSFPLGIHFSSGFFYQEDPGNGTELRKIFINNNTGGNNNIIKYGYNVSFLLEFSYPVLRKKSFVILAYAGVSHVRYLAHFDYVGGNEAFDITTNPWGISAGARFGIFLNSRILLSLNAGLEYLFKNNIVGHGTTYTPTGADASPIGSYTYDDADIALNQPELCPKIKAEILFKL